MEKIIERNLSDFPNPTYLKHNANIGDLIAALIICKSYFERTDRKVVICQQLNVKAHYYAGATHPTLHNGEMVMCNSDMLKMITPLLMAQEYIAGVEEYVGQEIHIDTTLIREKFWVNMPYHAIQQWLMILFPDCVGDISKAWVSVSETDLSGCKAIYKDNSELPVTLDFLKEKAIVNFTQRYRNPSLDYFYLENYKDNVLFSGTKNEYNEFTDKFKLNIPYLQVNDFLQLAYVIKSSKFLLSNQSFQWNLAAAMCTPRSLELCPHAPNCQPFIGEDNYGYYYQLANVLYFEMLMSK